MTELFEQKYAAARAELERASIWKSNHHPPLHRLLRKWGIELKPPHYNTLLRNSLSMGIYFAVVWGVMMYFMQWRSAGVALTVMLISAAIAGVLFGLGMGIYYRWSARRHSLSAWDEL